MARHGKIPFWTKFNFGFGQIGEAAFSAITLTFVSLYYNQALGLNIHLVGWALGLAIFSAAILAPIVGAFSDRFKSRWGRRHPFLFASAVPLALSLYFLFSPPEFLRAVKDIYQTWQSRNYLFLLLAGTSVMLSGGLGESIGPYMGTYYWEFEGAQLKWFSVAIMIGAVLGAWLTPIWIRRFEKRPVCISLIAGYNIVAPIPVLDRLTGLNILTPANHTPQLLPFLLVHAAICYHCMSGLGVCVMSMLADIIDQDTLKTGHVKTAIFYSARGLFSQSSRSLAILVGGFAMMEIVKMPVGAVPGKVGMDVINRLGLLFVLRLTATFASIFLYAQYRLSRAEQKEIRMELEERKRETQPV